MPFQWRSVGRIARWEFAKNARSPAFLILTLVMPVIMVIAGSVGFVAERAASEQAVRLATIDRTGRVFEALSSQLSGTPISISLHTGTEDELRPLVLDGEYDGFMVLDEAGIQSGHISLYVRDMRDSKIASVNAHLSGPLTWYRLQGMGLDPGQIAAATSPVRLTPQPLDTEAPGVGTLAVLLISTVALIMSTLFSGQLLMYGVIKEKRNRIVEILLSSVSSLELLLGKVIGLGGLSLLQVAVWMAAGLAVASRFVDLRELDFDAATMAIAVAVFVLGYILLATLFAALGATMKDAESGSQAHGLVLIVPLVPFFAFGLLMVQPNALWVRLLSHIPPFIPVTVLLRLVVTDLPAWELVTIAISLIGSVVLFIHLGARVFERTILQYDRALGLRDLRAAFRRARGGA